MKIVGLFERESAADSAIKELQNAGFNKNRFGVVARNQIKQKVNRQKDTEQGAVQADSKLGSAGGAAVGGLTGLLVSAGTLAIPGIGPVLAAGSLATVFAATGIGAAAGGLLGALTSLGISEKEADFYAEGLKRGGILVVVETDKERASFVKNVLELSGAVEVDKRRQAWQAGGWTTFDESKEPDKTTTRL